MRWNKANVVDESRRFAIEKEAIKAGEIPEDWKDKPAKRAQKDRDARWTVKYSKAKRQTETSTSTATRQHDIAIPMFGNKNHAGIDRAHGFIRGWTVTRASAHDEANAGTSLPRTTRHRRSGPIAPLASRPMRRG